MQNIKSDISGSEEVTKILSTDKSNDESKILFPQPARAYMSILPKIPIILYMETSFSIIIIALFMAKRPNKMNKILKH